MRLYMLLFVAAAAALMTGCGSQSPLPDTSDVKKQMPPGWKSKDVMIHINK